MRAVVLFMAVLVAAVPFLLVAQEWDDEEEGMSDEEFREFIMETIRKVAEAAAAEPPVVDPDCDDYVVKRYLTLLQTLPVSICFEETRFEDAVDFLRNVTGMNFYVSRQARDVVESAGDKVSLKLDNVPLKTVLVLLCKMFDGLTFGIKHDVLYIGTKEELVPEGGLSEFEMFFIEHFMLDDIVFRPPNFEAPDIALPVGDGETP